MKTQYMTPLIFLMTCIGLCRAADTPKVASLKTLVSSTGAGNAVREYQTFEIDLGKNTTDQDLKKLADLAVPAITRLNLATTDSKMTATGMKQVARLSDLVWLRVHYKCEDDGLKAIQGMKKLESLTLFQSKITDAGVPSLATFPKLRELNLERTSVTDAAFEPLTKVATLVKLELTQSEVSGKGIERLAALKKLDILALDFCKKVTDEAMPGVGKLKSLKELNLENTVITDAGLKSLESLSGLQKINVSYTKVTPEGIAAFKKALPKCKVVEK